MGNFSTKPERSLLEGRAKGYVALHIEQGVPVLDRDTHLLTSLATAPCREALAQITGDGAGGDGFAITALPPDDERRNDFTISAGLYSVQGLVVENTATIRYSAQGGSAAALTPFPEGSDETAERRDLVYLEVWPEEVNGEIDKTLRNDRDIGLQTSVRRRRRWAVRVSEGGGLPASLPADHLVAPLAEIVRPADGTGIAIERWMIRDLRASRLSLADLAERIERVGRVVGPVIREIVSNVHPATGLTTLTIRGDSFDFQDTRGPSAERAAIASFMGHFVDLPGPSGSPEQAYPRVTLAGVQLELVAPPQDRYSFQVRVPRNLPRGDAELTITTPGGTTRRGVFIEERWTPLESLAFDIAIAPAGNPSWLIHLRQINATQADYLIYRLLFVEGGYPGPWVPVPSLGAEGSAPPTFGASVIACDRSGVAWIVTAADELYRFNGTDFGAPLTSGGRGAVDIGVGANGEVWVVNRTQPSIAQWDPTIAPRGAWKIVVATPARPRRISVDPLGNPWIVTAEGQIFWYAAPPGNPGAGVWYGPLPDPVGDIPGQDSPSPLPGAAVDIAVGGDGVVWVVTRIDPLGDPAQGGWSAFSLRGYDPRAPYDYGHGRGVWVRSNLSSFDGESWHQQHPVAWAGSAISASADGAVWVADGMNLIRRRDLEVLW